MVIISNPLEQFEIFPVFQISNFVLLTNSSFFLLFSLFICTLLFQLTTVNGGAMVFNRQQQIAESFVSLVNGMINDTVGAKHGKDYIAFVFTIFSLILMCNLVGLIPYSFTVTSHLSITLTLAMIVQVGKLLVGFRLHGVKLFGMLLPGGTPFAMVPFLVVLELVAFCVTLVSLSVRLFANMMAGHILLNVFAGFAFSMLSIGGLFQVLHFLPLLVLFILVGLELGVGIVQAYVFSLLTCIYIADVIEGGH